MKLFFSDLDGTLLNDDKEITPATREALDQWVNAGHKLALCSGRPLPSMLEVQKKLALSYPGMYLIAFNGGLTYECGSGRIIDKTTLPLSQTETILERAREMDVYCHTYSSSHIISPRDCEQLRFYQKTIHVPVVFDPGVIPSLHGEEPCKCLAIELSDKSRLDALRASLLPWAEGKCQIIFSSRYLLEFFPAASGKGGAVRKLCSYLGIPLSLSVAAGDQENDISMLQTAGTGIAMINGIDEVKKAAAAVTAFDNNHDGLAPLLQELL